MMLGINAVISRACIALFLFLLQIIVNVFGNDLQLELVQVVFRHGDRNPVQTYPTDPYKDEKNWPEGFGQLTKIGKMQQYKMGQYLRQRYAGFLSETYSPYEILVKSSNIDRAIASAESNLAGLYPPNTDRSLWNKNIKWQPIPVHSLPENIDNLLNQKAPCPRYEQVEKEFFKKSETLHKINDNNKLLYQILSNHSGAEVKDPKDVDYLYDILFIEKLYNMSLPEWTNEIFPAYQDNITFLSAFSFKMLSYTQEMIRLKGGPLLKEMIENMKNKTLPLADQRRKFYMYSAHDTTVATLLNTLDVFELHSPPYTAMVIMELYLNTTSDEYFVQISYRNRTDRDPLILSVPGCAGSLCALGEFIDVTKSKIPNNWEQECKASSNFLDIVGIIVAGAVALLTIGLFVCFGLLVMSYVKNKRRGGGRKPPVYPYLHLQMEDGDDYG